MISRHEASSKDVIPGPGAHSYDNVIRLLYFYLLLPFTQLYCLLWSFGLSWERQPGGAYNRWTDQIRIRWDKSQPRADLISKDKSSVRTTFNML